MAAHWRQAGEAVLERTIWALDSVAVSFRNRKGDLTSWTLFAEPLFPGVEFVRGGPPVLKFCTGFPVVPQLPTTQTKLHLAAIVYTLDHAL